MVILRYGCSIVAMTMGLTPALAQVRMLPSQKVESAIDAIRALKAYSNTTNDICKGGALSWAKVQAAQLAYDDIYKATFNVGPECAQTGGTDALGLELVIPNRIKRLDKPDAFKSQCMQAWTDAIAVEKAFVEHGAQKIIENFRTICYKPASTGDNQDGATR